MLNILVLGISGNVSQGILKVLRYSQIECHIIGACVNINTIGDLWCDEVIGCPYANDENFINWLINVCQSKDVDLLLTGVEENLYIISKNIEFIKKQTKTVCIVSDYEKIVIGQDKLLTCKWLKENGFNYPLYAESGNKEAVNSLVEKVGYPLIAKPRKGKGSHGIFKVKNYQDLEKFFNFNNYVIQQCIGNDDMEYTVGCYYDKRGNSIAPIVMQRWLNDGATWKAQVIFDKNIKDECQKICKAFKPMGPMNIQLRLDNNERPVPFELNVRFSGTTPMRTHFGFRDVEAVIREYFENKSIKDLFNVKLGKAFRYVNEVYAFKGSNNLTIDSTLEVHR